MKVKTIFFCTECGNESPKWQGKCSVCGAWNTLVEQEKRVLKENRFSPSQNPKEKAPAARKMQDISTVQESRLLTKIGELDRVLGGGVVRGSLVLVGGEPGIGKSTLLLQICEELSRRVKVLYVSGEESEVQLKLRADRLGLDESDLYVYAENSLERLLDAMHNTEAEVVIVDSIQTLYHAESTSSPGSISQIKDCTMRLMQEAKRHNRTIFIISHVNKEGSIAGPKILEHMVDCVLYFEGESRTSYRILRAIKNRYGATNEMGMFEMQEHGLQELTNPSQILLSGRVKGASGTCVTCVMEGVRPILAEIQALLVTTAFGNPRRTNNGLDYNRALLLQAVLEKRCGLPLSTCDAYLNVVGGLRLEEPAGDLAIILAMASSLRDRALPEDFVALGEVGLTGELRTVNRLHDRLQEIRRLGFTLCMIPKQEQRPSVPEGLRLIEVQNIRDALAVLA